MLRYEPATGADPPATVVKVRNELLDFDLGTSAFELLLDLFGFFFAGTFFEWCWSALDELLSVSKAKTCDNAADFLNDCNLVTTCFSKDNVELGLLFSGCFATSGTAGCCNCYWSSGANAPLFFKGLHKFSCFKHGELAQFFCDFS